MRKKLWIILAMTTLICAAAIVMGAKISTLYSPFSVTITSDGHQETLPCMELEDGYYVFLPGYAEDQSIIIFPNPSYSISIDSQWLAEGQPFSVADFALDVPLDMFIYDRGKEHHATVTFLRSGNIPTMYIDVESGSMDYIHQKKGNRESGKMRIYSPEGQLECSVAINKIQGRGNSTWQWREKKPYSLSLSSEADLLNMGMACNWILLANGLDDSQLHNKVAYDLARNAGMSCTPDCQWVDLYLNGEYAGLYLLSERNEIHPERVNIPEENSFLVSWEIESRLIDQGYAYVKTKGETILRLHQSSMDPDEVQALWESAENAIFAEDGIDPVTGKGWQELIDLDSWAMLFLIDEVCSDWDGGLISKFFYYHGTNASGKIYAGPVWDKDDTFGANHWTVGYPNNIIASRSVFSEEPNTTGHGPIFYELLQKEEFSDRISELYETVFLPLLESLYDYGIDSYADTISLAGYLNQVRWDTENITEKIAYTKYFLGERTAFLNSYWIQKETFYNIKVLAEGSGGEFAIRPGEYLPELPQADGCAWFVAGTDTLFDVTQPIYENAIIVLKPLPQGEPGSDAFQENMKTEFLVFSVMVAGLIFLAAADLWQNRKTGKEYVTNK